MTLCTQLPTSTIADLLANPPRRKKMLLSMLVGAKERRPHSQANASTVARKAIRSLTAGLRVEGRLDRVQKERDLKGTERARSRRKGRERNRLQARRSQKLPGYPC